MYYSANNLGKARAYAQSAATRDGCQWIIYHTQYWYVNNNEPYAVCDQFEVMSSLFTKVEEVHPQKTVVNKEAVILTSEEKQLVAAVLSPDEPGSEYFPGTPKVKQGLISKLLGKKQLDK